MPNGSGRQAIYAGALVAVAILVGSFLVANGLDRVTAQLDRTTGRLGDLQEALARGAPGTPPPAPSRPTAQGGIDPSQRYTFDSRGSPVLGPATAAVKLVEFSDFQ